MTTLKLAKMPKGWYVPQDAQSYELLKSNGVPQLLISSWFLPTLRQALKRKKIEVQVDPFQGTLINKIDKIGSSWNARKGCKASIDLKPNSQSLLELSSPKDEPSRKLIAKIEANLASFFLRWGYSFFSDFNDKGARLKLSVTFQFKGNVAPMIPTVVKEDVKVLDTVLGFTKLRFSFFEKQTPELRLRNLIAPAVLLEIFTQIGTEWEVVHTGTFKPAQIADLQPLVATLGELSAKVKQDA
jgi:hypothetical protein